MVWWFLVLIGAWLMPMVSRVSALSFTTSVETIYYGSPRFTRFFFDILDHHDAYSTQVSLWRLLQNPSLPLHSVWSHREIDKAEARHLATCYVTWPGDQLHVPIPFTYLLQHQLLAQMILAGREAFGPNYYNIPPIDLPAPNFLIEFTSLLIMTSKKLLKRLLKPHLHEYRIWKTERSSDLLPFLGAPDAWDICDWLYSAHSGAYSSTMTKQKALARLGSVFGRYITYNFDGESYASVCALQNPDDNDPELCRLAWMTRDRQYYDNLVERIDQFTEEGTTRRTLWRAKLLLMALRILSTSTRSSKALSHPLTSPGSPAYLVRSFLFTHDVRQLPLFYLNFLVEAITGAGIMSNVLLYPQGRLAHTYLQSLPLEAPLPLAPLHQYIRRWRRILWGRAGSLRGSCNESRHQWRFYSYSQLLYWWSSYADLASCLLMDPKMHVKLYFPPTGPVLIRRLEKLLPHIVKAHRVVPQSHLSEGYLTERRALARTISTDILYRGRLCVPLPALAQADRDLAKAKSTGWKSVLDVSLYRILDRIGLQQSIPFELLRPNAYRKRRLSE